MVILILILSVTLYFVFFKAQPQDVDNDQVENYSQELEDGTKVNTSSKLSETKQIEDGLEITDISLTESNNLTSLLGKITNKTNEKKGDYLITITFVNKNGEKLTENEVYVKSLDPGETTTLSSKTSFDYTDAYDIIIEKKSVD